MILLLSLAGWIRSAAGEAPELQPSALARIEGIALNVRDHTGGLGCRLFASEVGFPQEASAAIAVVGVPLATSEAGCTFEGLAAGTYALVMLHDENGNRTLDTNFFGMPIEGYGVSNNVTHMMRAPSWEESHFTLAAGEQKRLEIQLRY